MSTASSSNDRSQRAGSAAMMPALFRGGFDLHPIQRRAAAATASKWRDALVTAIDANGHLEIVDFGDGTRIRLWNSEDRTAEVAVGSPVSFHPQYNVLAVGELWLSVRGAL
jgi:hypothetical protein